MNQCFVKFLSRSAVVRWMLLMLRLIRSAIELCEACSISKGLQTGTLDITSDIAT